ncbi:MAG: hypothetical protein AB8B63_16685, partial [Granulosicoccus sp.]
MDLNRVNEWIKTAEGTVKLILGAIGVVISVWVSITSGLNPLTESIGLPAWSPNLVAIGILGFVALLVQQSLMSFSRASRVENIDAFTLQPTDPVSLIGRHQDLADLADSCKQHRLVLLDGESGCGKSALVCAGLVPTFLSEQAFLPVLIQQWGDDWERGPLVVALDNLYKVLSSTEREQVGWTVSPDLTADTASLSHEFNQKICALSQTLGRRPILIGDQFDDYQARHHSRFQGPAGEWLPPEVLERTNLFWGSVAQLLRDKQLHVLIVTRDDTAAGCASVRLLEGRATTTRTLNRVEIDYLRPLIKSVAPDDAQPPVISSPERGWHELREQLEVDIKSDGAILMQQVRTTLLGLRELPVLSLRAYTNEGGIRGVETLYIERALERAARAASVGSHGLRAARQVLHSFVIRGTSDQPPKACTVHWQSLIADADDPESVRRIIRALQADEILRPAQLVDDIEAWQLDHDYLTTAVIAEAVQSDKQNELIGKKYRDFKKAGSGLVARWESLLPITVQLQYYWHKLTGRDTRAVPASYLRYSFVKSVLEIACVFLVLGIYIFLYQTITDSKRASNLVARLGTNSEIQAVSELWQAPPEIRQKVYKDVWDSKGSLERAASGDWWRAHIGADEKTVRQAFIVVKHHLVTGSSTDDEAKSLVNRYGLLAAKLTDKNDLTFAIDNVHGWLENEDRTFLIISLAETYATLIIQLGETESMEKAAQLLGEKLNQYLVNVLSTP